MAWPGWLGFQERRWTKASDEEVQPSKTAWDWLQLFIVPAMLAVIAVAFNASQASRDRSREDRRLREDRAVAQAARQDANLQQYFDRMSDLLLRHRLLRASSGSAVRQVARNITLATLRGLDGRRKGEVVRFLSDAQLLDHTDYSAPVDMADADLRGADMRGADLEPTISFAGADLRGARFDNALLYKIVFDEANLRRASFKRTDLHGVRFELADLNGAVFDYSSISTIDRDSPTLFDSACLTNSSFVGVNFFGAVFNGSQGRRVDFSEAHGLRSLKADAAGLTDVRLDRARGRPRGWGSTGPSKLHPWERKHPCGNLMDPYVPRNLPPRIG